jgi:transposase
MGKRQFQLTTEEIEEIQQILKSASADPVYDRLRAVLYYACGSPLKEISAAFGCSRSTMMSWCGMYRRFGPEGLVSRCMGGNNAHLDEAQIADLTRRLGALTPRQALGASDGEDAGEGDAWTVHDLYHAIRQWYGVVYRSPTSYYNLLKRYGPRRQP